MTAVWAQMIGEYLAVLAAGGQTEKTTGLRRVQSGRFAREIGCDPDDVTEDDLVAWMARHAWSIETRRSNRSTVVRFFRWTHKTGRTPLDPAAELPTVRMSAPTPRPAPDEAWQAALAVADPRQTLILRLAGEAGLRRSEIAAVRRGDLVEGIGGAQLLVHGKGQKKRVVPLSESLAALIRAGSAGHTPGTPDSGWLFSNGRGGPLTSPWIAELAQSVLPKPWTLHCCRHRFATRAYRGSRNLRAVQVLLGHASIATTERYTAVDDDEIRAAMMSAVTP